jgi:hypothetical protein
VPKDINNLCNNRRGIGKGRKQTKKLYRENIRDEVIRYNSKGKRNKINSEKDKVIRYNSKGKHNKINSEKDKTI